MKQLFLLAMISMALLSCSKPGNHCSSNQASLAGKWRMIIVKENASGSTTTKPASIQGEVDILFTSTNSTKGIFTGNTPTNEIFPSDFNVAPNQALTIPAVSMTKVAETSWGDEFVQNITVAQSYSFETDGKLNIHTVNKTLTFKKL